MSSLIKKPYFVSKNLWFLPLRNRDVVTTIKKCEIFGRQRDSNPLLVGYLSAVPLHICDIQAAHETADVFVSHGQDNEKKKLQPPN